MLPKKLGQQLFSTTKQIINKKSVALNSNNMRVRYFPSQSPTQSTYFTKVASSRLFSHEPNVPINNVVVNPPNVDAEKQKIPSKGVVRMNLVKFGMGPGILPMLESITLPGSPLKLNLKPILPDIHPRHKLLYREYHEKELHELGFQFPQTTDKNQYISDDNGRILIKYRSFIKSQFDELPEKITKEQFLDSLDQIDPSHWIQLGTAIMILILVCSGLTLMQKVSNTRSKEQSGTASKNEVLNNNAITNSNINNITGNNVIVHIGDTAANIANDTTNEVAPQSSLVLNNSSLIGFGATFDIMALFSLISLMGYICFQLKKRYFDVPAVISNIPALPTHYQKSHWGGELDNKIKQISADNQDVYPVQVAITGLPGSGKTNLAKYYAHKHLATSSLTWTITADTPEKLWQDYYLLAVALSKDKMLNESGQQIKIEKYEGEDVETYKKRICREVSQVLSKYPGWILIFDNVEKLSDIQQFLPNQGKQKGTIIFTTRDNSLLDNKRCLNISNGLQSNKATQLLEKITGLKSDVDAYKLAEALEHLPLYLLISASTIRNHNGSDPKNKWTYGSYLQHIQELTVKDIEEEHSLNIGQIEYSKTQHAVIMDAINKLSPEGQGLLKFCSYISPNIQRSLLEDFIKIQNKGLNETKANMKSEEVLREIQKSSLLQQIPDKSEYSIHRITQQIGQSYPIVATVANNMIDVVLNDIQKYENDLYASEARKFWEPLLPHILSLADNTKFIEIANLDHRLNVLLYSGRLQNNLGYILQAKNYYERALVISENYYGKNHIKTAEPLNGLGIVYNNLGDDNKAKECYKYALDISEKRYGKGHIKTAEPLNGLGRVCDNLGEHNEAKEYLERALAISEKLYGKGHIKTAEHLNSLGRVYINLGDDNKAKEYFQRALGINEKHYGEGHITTAESLNGLGRVYTNLGEHNDAKEYRERALAISEKHYGKGHIATAASLNGLGRVYIDLGNNNKAKEYRERALAISEKHYGEGHIATAASLSGLGTLCINLGDNNKAKEYFERALAISEKHYGKDNYGRDHAEVVNILQDLVKVYDALGDSEKAEEYRNRIALSK